MILKEKNRLDDYIMILKSLAVNFPILQSWGYIFPRLLKIVVEPGMQVRTLDALRNFNNQAYSTNWTSDFHFYVANTLSKDTISKMKMEIYERNPKTGICTVITDNPIADDEERNYFFVFLEEHNYQFNYRVEEIVPDTKDLESIHNKLRNQDETEMSEEERILRAAVYFLEPYFFHKAELSRVNELLDSVVHMCADDEVVREENDMSKVFLDNLYDWQEKTNFSNISDLDEGITSYTDINETVFYDEEFAYMTEKLFKRVVEPIREYAPINTLKRSLRDMGVISVDKGCTLNTYTIKVNIPRVGGSQDRVRMLRFKKESLAVAGDLDFILKCNLARKGDDYDEQNCRCD